MEDNKGVIIAVSAPSGTGKTTIVRTLLKEFPELVFSVSATTRRKRETEQDGVDYFFLNEDEFREKIRNEEFVEWEKFYDYYYGTLKSYIDDNINSGKSVVLEIDVKGALQVKKIYPDAVLVFILPPSLEELVNRLTNRNTEDAEELEKRIKRAKMELSLKNKFDYFIENNELNTAISDATSLIEKILHKGER